MYGGRFPICVAMHPAFVLQCFGKCCNLSAHLQETLGSEVPESLKNGSSESAEKSTKAKKSSIVDFGAFATPCCKLQVGFETPAHGHSGREAVLIGFRPE